MTAINDITGDSIATKGSTEAYRNNFDAIFRKKEGPKVMVPQATLDELHWIQLELFPKEDSQ